MAHQPYSFGPREKNESPAIAIEQQPLPFVSVIIPHYNDLDRLRDCLRLLQEQTLPRGQFEIVVGDNNSRCGFGEVAKACNGMARVVPAPVQGAGPARNAAIALSKGAILAFTDSDCRPSPTWLQRGVAALSSADMIGGRVQIDVADPCKPTAIECFEKVFAFNFQHYIEKLGFCGGANMFVPRVVFDCVGPFRTDVTEDMDWGQRASAANFRWRYAPDVVVSHAARRTWAEAGRKLRRRTREDFAMALERRHGRLKWFVRSFAILGSPFFHWAKIVRSSELHGPKERLKATAVLFATRFWRFYECQRILVAHGNPRK
jgi:glycosyltransferase involved in cell wall biosynthesis